MSSITKRILKNNAIAWRVQFRRKGWPCYSITFSDYKQAVKYADENEEAYLNNPDSFFCLNEKTRQLLKSKGAVYHRRRKYK